LSKGEHTFFLGTKINDPEGTPATLSLERLVSLETFTVDFQEEGEQVIDQQNAKGKDLDEVFQPYREEQRIVEDIVEELEPEQDDEVSTCPPPDEAIHEPFPPAQEEENEVSCFPFQDFDNTLFHDSKSEGEMESSNEVDLAYCTVEDEGTTHEDETVMHVEDTQVLKAPAQEETNTVSYPPLQNFDDSLLCDLGNEEEMDEPLNVLNLSCYDTDSDIVDIDEFIHVGRRKWDVVGYDMNHIYDIESNFQVLPLHLSQQVTLDFDQWQQRDDIITNTFQAPKVDLVPYFTNIFQSYLEDFDEYSSEHLDLFHEEYYQPPLCSDLGRRKNNVCLKKDSCDGFLQPPPITLPCCIIKGVVGKFVFCIEFPLRQTLEFKGRLNTSRKSLSSQPFNLPLRVCQSSSRSLSIPSRVSDYEDILGSQLSDLMSQFSEPLTFRDPFLKWIEHFPQRVTWHDFNPPTRLHELDFMVSNDTMHSLTHVIFVLNLSLFWFMMKHRGRYCETLLGWFHWSFDYT
jgi:hypothetical protein